ncbi:BON domain-containing protein [Roseovarius sp. SK2]|uniref:BON domain-containing protein n=1 Tax=Roseovarius TaxID=74030 RepID=UPI00237AC559|nr:BON domain-containing protein [Roseovarius sp. SK2]MDD9724588.1 BON domain-containing protein [Roseovarius sp. SK2]
MSRRLNDLTEQEARDELARHHRHSRRGPYGYDEQMDRPWDSAAYVAGRHPVAGYPWTVPVYPAPEPGMPAAYPGYPPRGSDYGYRQAPRGYEERGFLARAEDEVTSWFGDDAAQQRREVDHRGRGPKSYVRSDIRIEEDVNDWLTDDRDVDATEVSVGVKDREVTLDGTVDTRWAKRAAEDCADSVSGVVHVQNNLRVDPAAA